MNRTKNNNFVNIILHISGLLLCIFPPALCALMYFPLWCSSGAEKTLAGGAALIIILSAAPLFKFLKKHFESPSSYIMWLIVFVLFFSLSKIAHEMTVIAFVGFVSNLIGAVCFYFAKRNAVRENE